MRDHIRTMLLSLSFQGQLQAVKATAPPVRLYQRVKGYPRMTPGGHFVVILSHCHPITVYSKKKIFEPHGATDLEIGEL